ncbi:allantoinase, partial [Streptomyces sp. NPDC057062]
MSDAELVLRSRRVITPEGTRAATVVVAGGTITAVLPYDAEVPAGALVQDVGGEDRLPPPGVTPRDRTDTGRAERGGVGE